MERLNNIKNMKYFKITFAFSVNLLIMILFLLFTTMNYEIADNQTYSLFIADGDYQIIFLNYFLCAFCGLIQKLIYPLNAFVIVHLIFCFLGFVAITRVFLDKFRPIIAFGITLFVNGFFAVNHYETVSFTRAPGLLCAVGFLCIIHYVSREKWKTGTIIGILFVLVGSMYRFEIFEVAVAVAVCFVVAYSISEYFSLNKNGRKIKDMFKIIFAPKRLIICIITVALCFSVNFISTAINTSTEELKYFSEYTAARSAVWDYPIPDYEECKEEYDAIGIDANDIEMLRIGYMDDEGAFTLEKLRAIKDIQTQYNKETKSIVHILKNMIIDEIGNIRAFGDKGIALFAFGLVVIAFLIVMRKRMYFIPLFLSGLIFMFYSYLWVTGKCPFRAVYVLWISAVLYLFYSFSYKNARNYVKKYNILSGNKSYIILILLIISSIAGLYLSRIANDSLGRYQIGESSYSLQSYLENQSDKKFELGRNAGISRTKDNNVFSVWENPIFNYCESFNCTYYNHPNYLKKLKRLGTDNMYSYLLDDNVYFVENENNPHIDMIEKYLQKYYSDNSEVNYEIVDSVDNYRIIKFYN